jgi:hypothetical protein
LAVAQRRILRKELKEEVLHGKTFANLDGEGICGDDPR